MLFKDKLVSLKYLNEDVKKSKLHHLCVQK